MNDFTEIQLSVTTIDEERSRRELINQNPKFNSTNLTPGQYRVIRGELYRIIPGAPDIQEASVE